MKLKVVGLSQNQETKKFLLSVQLDEDTVFLYEKEFKEMKPKKFAKFYDEEFNDINTKIRMRTEYNSEEEIFEIVKEYEYARK